MDARTILDNLLDKTQRATAAGSQMAQDRGLLPKAADERTAMLKGMGTGALAAGAVAMLLGNKRARKFSKKALKIGGTAAIGGLAYTAFTEWKAQQTPREHLETGTPINDLPSSAANARGEAIVQAMISAARADGHLDELEQAHITQQITTLGLELDVTRFLITELVKPVDPKRIASLADSPEAAAEMYLASALIIDKDNPDERQYLASLARSMGLTAEMVRRLEAPLYDEATAA